MSKSERDQIFEGFSSPRYTQVPDQLLDQLMPDLSEAELKVVLYIVRRTFGWAKNADAISLNQMIDGITTRDGRVIDRGTGLSRSSVRRGISGLVSKGIILVNKIKSEEGDYETNVYSLRFRENTGVVSNSNHRSFNSDTPVVPNSNYPPVSVEEGPISYYPSPTVEPPVVPDSNLQETVKQETDSQDRPFEISKGQQPRISYSETRMVLQPYIADFAREFRDQATQTSSLTRAVNLCDRSGLEVDDFIEVMFRARAQTQEYSASIRAKVANGDGWGGKTKMAYFFTVLEDMLGLRNQSQRSGD